MLNVVFTFVVITTIALFAIATIAFYRFPELDFLLFLQFVRLKFVQALTFLLPLSLLIAVVFVYGRAAADHEITTLKASGIHPYRVLLPGLLIATLLSSFLLQVASVWDPRAIWRAQLLPEQQDTIKNLLERRIANGDQMVQFGDQGTQRTLHWQKIELPESGGLVLEDVLLESEPERDEADPRVVESTRISAERAIVRFDEKSTCVVLRLEKPRGLSGPIKDLAIDGAAILKIPIVSESDRMRLKFHSSAELVALALRGNETVELGGRQLSVLRRFDLPEVEGRIHERIAHAMTPIVFLLLGAPFALIFKSGNRLIAFLLASLIAMFIYYPTELLGNFLMKQQLAEPLLACWSGNLLLSGIGVGLLLFVVRR